MIKNKKFRPKFLQNWPTPKGKTSFEHPQIGNTTVLDPEICQYLSLLDNINTPKTPVHENFLHCVLADDGIWKGAPQSFRRKTHYFG